MPPAGDLASDSLLISSGLGLIAVFLGLRQWYEHRARESDLSQADLLHFRRQDLRRSIGVGVILLLAAGLYLGSRIPLRLQNQPNPAFIEAWTAIVGLLGFLMALALFDVLATRRYARRKRQSMAREKLQMLRDVIRRHDSPDPSAGDGEEPN